MKKQIRTMSYTIGMISVAVGYYILFFTRLFDVQIRSLAYTLSGSNVLLRENVAMLAKDMNQVNQPNATEMFQAMYSAVTQHIQFGPYMNFSVYMVTLFAIVPLFLVSTFVLKRRSVRGSMQQEKQYFTQFKQSFLNYMYTAFLLSAFGGVLTTILSTLTQANTTSANQAAIQNNLQNNFLISIVPIVILAPIIEEIVFRGVLLSGLKQVVAYFTKERAASRKIKIYGHIEFELIDIVMIIISSAVFALIHLTTNFNQWIYFPSYFFGGVALGSIYVWNKERLYVSIIVHAVYNALPILVTTILRLITKG